jgi:hypothetical protein
MKNLFAFLAILFIFTSWSCNKIKSKCRYLDLPGQSCGKGYSTQDGAIKYIDFPISVLAGNLYLTNPLKSIIKTDSAYKALFNGKEKFGTIDFTKNWLIGIAFHTNPGSEIKKQAWVCTSTPDIILNVQYSLKDQCNGSNISTIDIEVWAIVPNYSNNARIIFNLEDINPYN